MNIALQMAREDFAANFCETLAHFLAWRDGRAYQVTWNGNIQRQSATLYVHPRLGIVTRKWSDPRQFRFIWRELRTGKNLLESVARRLYLAAHLAPGPTRPRMAAHHVTIEPKPVRFDDGFYLPGGHQLRWFDVPKRRCYVAVKRNFPSQFFTAQLDVRENYPCPAPHLFEVDRDALIFSEETFEGAAHLNAGPKTESRLACRALAALEPLAQATAESTTTSKHATTLANSIAQASAGLNKTLRTRLRGQVERLREFAGDEQLTTTLAHGDLTYGHILENRERIVLVDWEHSARRQQRHDELALALKPQQPAQFFAKIAHQEPSFELALLILEALDLTTWESNNPAINGPTTGLLVYLDAVEKLWP